MLTFGLFLLPLSVAFSDDDYGRRLRLTISVAGAWTALKGRDNPAQGQVARLTASDGEMMDRFGGSVSVDGDVVLIGTIDARPCAAYIFERNAGGVDAWGEVVKLTASDSSSADKFGGSVSVDGDVALVGASGAAPSGMTNTGAAYVYARNVGGTNAWGEIAKLIASDGETEDYFGISVSVAGGVALVGANLASFNGMPHAGAAYLFEGLITNEDSASEMTVLGLNGAVIVDDAAPQTGNGTQFKALPLGKTSHISTTSRTPGMRSSQSTISQSAVPVRTRSP